MLPAAVHAGSAEGAMVTATVTSVLFEVTSYSVTLESDGTEFRARMAVDPKPEVGDRVEVKIQRPLVYLKKAL